MSRSVRTDYDKLRRLKVEQVEARLEEQAVATEEVLEEAA